jgi:MOSC domain-containing protein YiiM
VSKLLSIQVGRSADRTGEGQAYRTAIYKQGVEGPVMVRTLGIDGDEQADLSVHGGVDKAVYCYPAEHYPVWEQELGRSFAYGVFGENLTVEGLSEQSLQIGDVLDVGETLLQVSEPRLPCFKLGYKIGDQGFLKWFLQSERCGFYCRVLREGLIEAGQVIEIVERNESGVTIAESVAAVGRKAEPSQSLR